MKAFRGRLTRRRETQRQAGASSCQAKAQGCGAKRQLPAISAATLGVKGFVPHGSSRASRAAAPARTTRQIETRFLSIASVGDFKRHSHSTLWKMTKVCAGMSHFLPFLQCRDYVDRESMIGVCSEVRSCHQPDGKPNPRSAETWSEAISACAW